MEGPSWNVHSSPLTILGKGWVSYPKVSSSFSLLPMISLQPLSLVTDPCGLIAASFSGNIDNINI